MALEALEFDMNIEDRYLTIAHEILNAPLRPNRTGTSAYSIFGATLQHNFAEGFPLLTTKKMFWKGIVGELLWFLRGGTNIDWLNKHNIHIWDDWANEDGDLGNIYGKQWREWSCADGTSIDQVALLIDGLKNNPYGRRHIINAWNVGDIVQGKMALPPCHMMAQFYVENNSKLSLTLYQRSADWFLGVPFNIASYALLLCIIAKEIGTLPNNCIYHFGDAHIYENHASVIYEQLSRNRHIFPSVSFDKKPFDGYEIKDFKLTNYKSEPALKGAIAV